MATKNCKHINIDHDANGGEPFAPGEITGTCRDCGAHLKQVKETGEFVESK